MIFLHLTVGIKQVTLCVHFSQHFFGLQVVGSSIPYDDWLIITDYNFVSGYRLSAPKSYQQVIHRLGVNKVNRILGDSPKRLFDWWCDEAIEEPRQASYASSDDDCSNVLKFGVKHFFLPI